MAKKSGLKLEIIPNMYELGFFKKTLASRKKLRLTALFAIIALLLAFFGIGLFLHFKSTSFALNAFLLIILYAGVLIISYLLALVIGDVVFYGPWREKMAKGDAFIPEDLEEQKALLKNKNIFFILIWLISIVVLGFGCDFATGKNISWYQNVGGIILSMKSDNPDERVLVLKTISNAFHSQKWQDQDIRENITRLALDDNDEVRAWAAYVSGRAKISEAADALKSTLGDSSRSNLARSEAAIALARMEWSASRALLISTIRNTFSQSHSDTELIPAALFAFYLLKDSMAVPETIQLLKTCRLDNNCSPEILQYAFFYLKFIKAKDAAALSFEYIHDPNISNDIRCLATDILRFTAAAQNIPDMKHEFDLADPNLQCPVIYRKYHEEAAIILFEHDYLRSLLLRAIGNLSMDNGRDYDWIWSIGNNTSENQQTRKVAEMYTRAMHEKGIVK